MNVRSLVIGAMLALASTFAAAADNSLTGKPDDANFGVYMAATLAPAGSFEFQAAPAFTKLRVFRHNSVIALRKGAMTVPQFEKALKDADAVRTTLDRALAACSADRATGKCRGDERTAAVLLRQANDAVAKLK